MNLPKDSETFLIEIKYNDPCRIASLCEFNVINDNICNNCKLCNEGFQHDPHKCQCTSMFCKYKHLIFNQKAKSLKHYFFRCAFKGKLPCPKVEKIIEECWEEQSLDKFDAMNTYDGCKLFHVKTRCKLRNCKSCTFLHEVTRRTKFHNRKLLP